MNFPQTYTRLVQQISSRQVVSLDFLSFQLGHILIYKTHALFLVAPHWQHLVSTSASGLASSSESNGETARRKSGACSPDSFPPDRFASCYGASECNLKVNLLAGTSYNAQLTLHCMASLKTFWLCPLLTSLLFNCKLRYISTHVNTVADTSLRLQDLFHCSRFCPNLAACPVNPRQLGTYRLC